MFFCPDHYGIEYREGVFTHRRQDVLLPGTAAVVVVLFSQQSCPYEDTSL